MSTHLPPDEDTLREYQLEKQYAIESAREDLLAFIQYTMPWYRLNWHHKVICKFATAFALGKIRRLMIFAPPRHGKSEIISRRMPAFILGRDPNREVITASYAAKLAQRMNRDTQRIIMDKRYAEVFPGTTLNSKNIRTVADGNWLRNSEMFEIVGHRGSSVYTGVGGSVTGMGANEALVDDPIRNYADASSPALRERVWDWYTSTLYTRLAKNGGIMLTLCMTGDTPVLRPDGTQTPLRDLRPGDAIATYEGGRITRSTVLDWRPQGPDFVYKIKTSSGITVRANARHPFLVRRDGSLKWVRLKELRTNDEVMRVGEHTRGSDVCIATNRSSAKAFACPTTTNTDGHPVFEPPPITPPPDEILNYATDTEWSARTTRPCSESSGVDAQYVSSCPSAASICRKRAAKSFASTIATGRAGSAGCFVTSATSSLGTPEPKSYCSPPSSICGLVPDPIVSIEPCGRAEVFDIQVDRTENFIANGLVSHNTRWHEDDLAGRVMELMENDPEADQWTILNFPAIKEGPPTELDPRAEGEALWPESFPKEELLKRKANSTRKFQAMYQGAPSPADGEVFKSDWWKFYDELPSGCTIRFSADTTFKGEARNDYFVIQVWGEKGADHYLIAQIRKKMGYRESRRRFKRLALQRYPMAREKYVEDSGNGDALYDGLKSQIPGIILVRAKESKIARAEAASPAIESGNVFLPNPVKHPWVKEYLLEFRQFPNGKHDDQVDATSQYLNKRVFVRKSRPKAGIGGTSKQSQWGRPVRAPS